MEIQYASNGKGNLGITLGAIGTGLSVLNGGLGLLGNTNNNGSKLVSKDELDYVQTISDKNSEIALLKSEQNTENKITEVYRLLKADMNSFEKEQTAINSAQAVYNATSNSAIAVLQNQVSVLNGLTKTVVPINNVCPTPMPLYNSWKEPTTVSGS